MTDSSRSLDALFNFSSLAFVGASDTAHFGLGAYRALRDIGFTGAYFPVNVKRETVHGVRAYPSASEIPQPIDAAVISVARQHVLPAFEQCADRGARAIVVLSGNFGERDSEGKHLQQKLADMARERGVILVGPNCMGAASVLNSCALYQGRGLDVSRPGGVAVVSQSGGLMNELLHYGNARALGFSHLISSGNEADVTLAQAIVYYVDDPSSKIILAIVETVREPELFLTALDKAVVAGKPIVVLKLGSSEKGARSALTHTGALAGNDAVWDALLRQKAAIRVKDIDEMVDVAAMLNGAVPILAKRTLSRAAVIEISGGATELVCDLCEMSDLTLPELSPDTVAAIEPTVPEFLHVGNPIDAGTLWVNPAMGQIYPVTLEALASQDDFDIIVSRFIVPPEGELDGLRDRLEEFRRAREAHPDRLFVVITPTSNRYIDEWLTALAEYDVPFVPGFRRGFSALGKVAAYSRAIAAIKSAPPAPALPRQPSAVDQLGPIRTVLNEVESKNLLRNAGFPVVETRLARTAAEACAIGEQLGFPVAAKAISPQMTHKSDAGGVRLYITSASDLAAIFEEFKSMVGQLASARFDGISVQPMAEPGLEVVLGAHRDPHFGPVLMFGLGGIFVEVLNDIALRVAPIREADANAMLEEIRAQPLLAGTRGRPGVHRASIVDALCRLSALMLDRADIESVDVNPALSGPSGLIVVDARIVLVSDDVSGESQSGGC